MQGEAHATPGLPEIVFKERDKWGNPVLLYEREWQHIRKFHPEMLKVLGALPAVLVDPSLVSESTIEPNTLIFDSYNILGGSDRILRVVVRYEKRELIEEGKTLGSVATAYGPTTAATGNVGKVIYFSGIRRSTE